METLARVSEGTGAITVSRTGVSSLIITLEGRLQPHWGPWLTETLDEHRDANTTLYIDASGVAAFGGSFKSHMIGWMRIRRTDLIAAHVLASHPMVRVAAAVANMTLRGWVTAHPDAESFAVALNHHKLRRN